jgi:hypothetical protein
VFAGEAVDGVAFRHSENLPGRDVTEAESGSPARRRRTRPSRAGADAPAADEPQRKPPTRAERDAERGLRGLIGAGPSQVSLSAAMRARDASRPTDEDLSRADRDTELVRRHYVPTEAAPFEIEPRPR